MILKYPLDRPELGYRDVGGNKWIPHRGQGDAH